MFKNILKKASCLIIAAMSAFCMVSCADIQETTATPSSFWGDSGGEKPEIVYKEIEYMTFEEMCASVDYIVIASYIDAIPYDDNYAKFTIDIKESLYGDLSGQIDFYPRSKAYEAFKVNADGREVQFWDDRFRFHKQTDEIVFFLVKENIEGFDEPQYTWHGAPMVNLSNLNYSEMYSEPISKHMTGFDFDNATREEVLAYIKSLVANRNVN